MSAELLLKAVADETRIKIILSLKEKPKFVEQIAMELNISVSTASFHLKKLLAVGFVVQKKQQYYQIYSLNENIFDLKLKDVIFTEARVSGDLFKDKVIDECFENERLKKLPVQVKKREVILGEIIKKFDKGVGFSDKQAHIIIADVYDDFIVIKNMLIESGYLIRDKRNGKLYAKY